MAEGLDKANSSPLSRPRDAPAAADGARARASHATEATMALVARCRQGDRRAFDELMVELAPTLRAVVWNIGAQQDPAWREDTVVEAMVQIYRSISAFRGDSSFRGWSSGVCTRVSLSRLRAERRRTRFLEPLTEHTVGGDDPAEAIGEMLLGERVRSAVLQLPLEYRLVFSLRCVAGCSYSETAAILRIPEGTVKSRMFEAKKRLLRMIPPQCWDAYYDG